MTKCIKQPVNSRHFPIGWDEERVHQVLSHYENQTDEGAASEDAAAFRGKGRVMIEIPAELIPVIREIIAQSSGH